MQELATQISQLINWLFNAIMQIGMIGHHSNIFMDVGLACLGYMWASRGRVARSAGRYYASVKSRVKGLK